MKNNILLICALLSLLQGCSSISPPPLESLPKFLDHRKEMAVDSSVGPFLLMWFADKKNFAAQNKLYSSFQVLPVETKFIEIQPDSDVSNEDIKDIADYSDKVFKQTFVNDSALLRAEGKTLYIELAIVKLVPTNSTINIAENVAGVFIPGSILVTSAASAAGGAAAHELGKGEIAIAVKIKREENNQDFVEIYDERADRDALIINFEDFSRLGNAKTNIDEWAKEFYSLLKNPDSEPIDGPSAVAVAVW